MEDNTKLIKTTSSQPAIRDNNTGLIIGNTFLAKSGFEYTFGLRKFGDLTIAESVGQGVGVSYLNSVRVFNGQKELIIDRQVKRGTFYTREKVRQIVLEELLEMLSAAALKEGKEYDFIKARVMIDEKLENAYFEESYKAVLEWAGDIGIEFREAL